MPLTTLFNNQTIDDFVAAFQSSVNGFPVYNADQQVQQVYGANYPQRIRASGNISIGQLVNIYFAADNTLRARLASSSEPQYYANGIALTPTNADGTFLCGVETAYCTRYPGISGVLFLGITPGSVTNTLGQGKIVQKVGYATSQGIYFQYNTPALVAPENYSFLRERQG